MMADIKEQLYLLCVDYLRAKEADIKKNIAEAQEAASNETKSSAGDKYETGREVMQQEIDLNLTRLNELHKLKNTLEHILPAQKTAMVVPGAIAYTNNGNYYISISAGLLQVDGVRYYAISAASPIGGLLMGQKAGATFELNGKRFVLERVG